MFLFGFIVSGSHLTVNYEFLSPLASDKVEASEIKDFKMEIVKHNYITLRVSHYWPELGGVNCGHFVNGECISKMANGERWQENTGYALACPKELEFGTKIKIKDRVWECKDRGSRITKDGDVYWIDMLVPFPLYNYGEEVTGEIL